MLKWINGTRRIYSKKTKNNIFVIILKGISFLPFWATYLLSDFFYIVIRYLIRYRKKVIATNLQNSFPEKSQNEIKKITGKFYHHFCDVFIETIKAYGASEKKMAERVHFNNVDMLQKEYENGNSIVLLSMHHNNWEWSSLLSKFTNHKTLAIYNPIRGNKALENLLLKIRGNWGAILVPGT